MSAIILGGGLRGTTKNLGGKRESVEWRASVGRGHALGWYALRATAASIVCEWCVSVNGGLAPHFLWMFMLVVECFMLASKSDTICPPVPSDAKGMGAIGLSFSRLPFRASFFEPTVLRGLWCGGGGGGVSGWRFGGGPLRLDGSQATAAGFRLALVISIESGAHVGASSWHLPASLLAGARVHGVWNRHTGHLGKPEAKLVDGRVAALCPDLAC